MRKEDHTVEISLDKIQTNMAKEARRFLKKEAPIDYVNEMFDDEKGYTKELWSKMNKMDWMKIRIPEAYGGLEMDQLDLCIIMEEMGRALLPGPFFSTVNLAAEAIIEAGTAAQKKKFLTRIGKGKLLGTLALYELDSGGDPEYVQMKACKETDGFLLNGTKLYVPDAQVADFLVCVARTSPGEDPAHGITLFLVDGNAEGVTITPLPTMDGTRKLSEVTFTDVHIPADGTMGTPDRGWEPLSKALQRCQVGLCAECVGGAHRAMEIAADYAKTRIQFDQPIGSFQAIKHKCAQMYVDVESARSILYWAAWAQDCGDRTVAAMSASVAKSYCSEAYTRVASEAIQVLGGMGMTWESEVHFFLKRAKGNEIALGDPVYHRERVCQLLSP
jgi:alkylation response protein AidB-like acyl-CoA dehydrogenase